MCKYKPIGFTLFELMVAVLIISILAAVSGPIYKSYVVKSKFAEVFNTIGQYKADMDATYLDNDQFPSAFSTVTDSTYSAITSNVLQLLYYGRSTDLQSAYLFFYTLDLGVDGYVQAASNGSGGTHCRVTFAAIPTTTGNMQFYCGQWDGSSIDVPLTYLPQSCQDTNISALIS